MPRLLREPLIHFLCIGAGLFLLFHVLNERDNSNREIVVTTGKIQNLAENWSRTWQRPPTSQELEGLVQDYIKEEILYREATTLGLDRDDTIIRRRLRQKMEFITDDIVSQVEPTDEELGSYLITHADTFRLDQQFTFRHVYLNPNRHGDTLQNEIERLLTHLNKLGEKADITFSGDSFLLDREFAAASRSDVSKVFGEKFAEQLVRLEPGKWQGPVTSGYGEHLVFISSRTEGRMPKLEEIRDVVLREWSNAQRIEANEKFYQSLRAHYTVTVERPQPKAEKKKLIAEAQQ